MSILSITFHTVENQISNWDLFMETELLKFVENISNIDKFVLSNVDSRMINEGKNSNLLLVFETVEGRDTFLAQDFGRLGANIFQHFGDQVMVFPTLLNPIKKDI